MISTTTIILIIMKIANIKNIIITLIITITVTMTLTMIMASTSLVSWGVFRSHPVRMQFLTSRATAFPHHNLHDHDEHGCVLCF